MFSLFNIARAAFLLGKLCWPDHRHHLHHDKDCDQQSNVHDDNISKRAVLLCGVCFVSYTHKTEFTHHRPKNIIEAHAMSYAHFVNI